MFGFAVAVCNSSKHLPALAGLLTATAVAIGCIIFMVHEAKRQTRNTLKVAYIAGGIIIAPLMWLLIALVVMPIGCF
ncbi:MAG TPA: hypothetical protein VLF62_04515 [Candidatus Saccharimonadales bacterium]|nr:hypothetical protein [Candidatus Saccharimonadales bacterium]